MAVNMQYVAIKFPEFALFEILPLFMLSRPKNLEKNLVEIHPRCNLKEK